MEPETLMALAQLAAQQTLKTPIARYSSFAWRPTKAPDDPRSIGVNLLAGISGSGVMTKPIRTGSLEHPSFLLPTEGPLWRVQTLREVVTEWFPRRQEHLREVERKLLNGEIPISLAARRI